MIDGETVIKARLEFLGFPCNPDLCARLADGIDVFSWSQDCMEKIDVNLFHTLPLLIAAPTSISESGFSLSRNTEQLKNLYIALYKKYGDKYGLEDTLGIISSIQDVSDVW